MEDGAKLERIAEFERRSREQGLRLTPRRRVILEAVLELANHPSADDVFDVVAHRIPRIARTTVYRTLDEFQRMGLVAKASHPGHAVRYDARTDRHHHLVCTRCNEFIDITDEQLDTVAPPDTSAHGFEVSEVRVQLLGTCATCRARERKEESK